MLDRSGSLDGIPPHAPMGARGIHEKPTWSHRSRVVVIIRKPDVGGSDGPCVTTVVVRQGRQAPLRLPLPLRPKLVGRIPAAAVEHGLELFRIPLEHPEMTLVL